MVRNIILYFFFLYTHVFSFQISIHQQDQQFQDTCNIPLITQYQQNIKIPLDDMYKLMKGSPGIYINNTKDKKTAIISNVFMILSYPQMQRTINYKPPVQASVQNQKFNLKLSYKATTKKKNYSIITYIPQVPTNYTKKLVQENFFNVSNVVYKLDPQKFNITFVSNPSKQERQKIQTATKVDLIVSLRQSLDGLAGWLNHYANQQHIKSQIYQTSPYTYKYNQFSVKVNMQNLVIQKYNNKIQYGLKGRIGIKNQLCPFLIPQPQENYHTFYSEQFIMNMAQITVQNYTNYQHVNISSSIAKSRIFQFRVIDLQYVIDNLLTKYSSYYLNHIYFICQLRQINNTYIDVVNNRVNMDNQWSCKGYIQTDQESVIFILDFNVYLSHKLKIFVMNNSLKVYVDSILLKQTQFIPVKDLIVNNQKLADNYLKSILDSLFGYTIGSQFMVKKGSSKTKLTDIGLWVG